MKILKTLTLDKYSDSRKYTPVKDSVYKNSADDVYCVTLYCELGEDEDTQYPLEDILDQYYVNCTDVMEERQEAGKHIFIFEVEGDSLESIQEIAGLVGTSV